MLGQYGHRVIVLERYAAPYPLPRAVGFDGEVRRIFHRLGIDDAIASEIVPVDAYEWIGADGNPSLTIDFSARHRSGWATTYLFYQPVVEAALNDAAQRHPSVTVRRGWDVCSVVQHDSHVEVGAVPAAPSQDEDALTVRARWVIGADGANSLVRNAAGIGWDDFGFAEQWLVVDVRPHEISQLSGLPRLAQVCDPRRPHAIVANGSTHRRWEFMLLDGEQPDDFTEERVWQLLSSYISPDVGVLVRRAVYEFRSLSAQTFRDRRILLAGDAAHLMPPFMGKGMCSGVIDAANLAWKLDFVIRGLADAALLDTYGAERKPATDAAVQESLTMGQFSCTLDPDIAHARDAALRAGLVPPVSPPPMLKAGVLRAPGVDALAGSYAVQPLLAADDGSTWMDDLCGGGFVLVTITPNPDQVLGPRRLELLDTLGATIVTLASHHGVGHHDADGRLSDWMHTHGVSSILVRPDGYTFGSAGGDDEVIALVDDLAAHFNDRGAGDRA
ncbi:bifunctional 3-(3-hydroxy-phenyl)propionate/3-hydroxycinnamic acid hydroxylase [Mycolicibacterium sp. CBM1]